MALTDKLTAIANSIRGKTGESSTMTLDQMPIKITNIPTGGPTSITVFSIVNNATYGYTNHLITDIVWADVKKIEIWFKHLEVKTNNMLFAGSSNSGGTGSPWISETSSGGITIFNIDSVEVVDGYTHQTMSLSTSNTSRVFIGGWTDSNYSSINAYKRVKIYGDNDTLLNDMTPAKMGDMIGFYDEITNGFYAANNFNAIVEGEYS